MCRLTFSLITAILVLLGISGRAQDHITTIGFQFKPIFSSRFFNTSHIETLQNNILYELKPTFGYAGGMIIRRGITKRISFETGINYVKRDYMLRIADGSLSGTSSVTLIGYEVPISILVFVRMSDRIYMNTSLGFSLDMMPSNVLTYDKSYYRFYARRNNWLLPGINTNLGWEYRTRNSGYIYTGVSYHRPFTYMASTITEYFSNGKNETLNHNLQGNYLTIDIRYFFHEEPNKKRERKKRKSKTIVD